MPKYEFTGETKIVDGVTLKRIRALIELSSPGIRAGTLGGWLEHEHNLSHEGNCWVYEDAQVYGRARVFEQARVGYKARVYDSSLVSGYALIYGYAELCGDTNVYGNAAVFGNARISSQNHIFWATGVGMDNGTLTVFTGPGNSLIATRGCYLGTVEEFLAKSKRVHNKRVHQEYCLLIEVAKSRITA